MELSVNRRTMLRLVAFSEVERSYSGALEVDYTETHAGIVDGWGKNALGWLEQNGFIHCVGEKNWAGLRAGLMRPTSKGSLWLTDNKIGG